MELEGRRMKGRAKRRSVGVVKGYMQRVGVTEEGGMEADDPLWRTLRGATKRRKNNVCMGKFKYL